MFYLVNSLLKTRNKAYTTTLPKIAKTKNMNKNSHKGFKLGVISLIGFFGIIIITKYLNNSPNDSTSVIIGFLTISIGIISIIGIVKSIRGLKEPNTLKKITGLILNFGFLSFFLFVITENFLDVLQLFKE